MTWFWWYLLCMDLLIPFTMIGFGICFLRRPPKQRNSWFGYRTARSMKSEEAWQFAHSYCGKIWVQAGKWLLPGTGIALWLVRSGQVDWMGLVAGVVCAVQLLVLVGSLFLVELALKKREVVLDSEKR